MKKLYKQCKKAKINFEILCFDDGSKEKYKLENRELNGLFGINYMELSENLGRSKIRNWLVKSAVYEYVVFLDCDSKVLANDFIEKYLQSLQPNAVVNGGRIYSKSKPRAKSKQLHWMYGSKYESKKASKRNKYPHQFFHTNNFAADRNVLVKNPFNESIKGYGYEDLLMAKELVDKTVQLIHIDNPVEHLGLEKNKDFLEKNLEAVRNLKLLNQDHIKLNTRLEKWAKFLKDYDLSPIFNKYMKGREEQIKSSLLSDKPRVFSFQLLKLYEFMK